MDRPNILAIAFVVLTIFSLFPMAQAANNYLDFFPALKTLRAELIEINFENPEDNDGVRMYGAFQFENPSDYVGIGVRWYEMNAVFSEKGGGRRINFGTTPFDGLTGPLDPRRPLDGSLDFVIPGIIGEDIIDLYAAGRLHVDFDIRVLLSTFIDSIAELNVTFNCSTEGGPVECTNSSSGAYLKLRIGGGGGGGA